MLFADKIIQQMKSIVPNMPNKIFSYSSNNVAVFKPSMMFEGPARFDCYEFLLTLDHIPDTYIEKRQYSVGKNKLVCINPTQAHGATKEQPVTCYIPLFIDKHTFNDFAYAVAGKTNMEFSNNPCTYDTQLLAAVQNFINESSTKQLAYDFIMQSISAQIVAYLIRNTQNSIRIQRENNKYKEGKPIDRVIEYLWENYDKDFTFEEIAKTINYSPYHFIRIFKGVTGKTPHEYLMDIKIQKATEELKHTENSITEICYICGFNNLNHFSSVFKKRIGVSPTQYRKSL